MRRLLAKAPLEDWAAIPGRELEILHSEVARARSLLVGATAPNPTAPAEAAVDSGLSSTPSPLNAASTQGGQSFSDEYWDASPVARNAVLLTGATGFLGAFLLSELVKAVGGGNNCGGSVQGGDGYTPTTRARLRSRDGGVGGGVYDKRVIVCLVRAADDDGARGRLKATLAFYRLASQPHMTSIFLEGSDGDRESRVEGRAVLVRAIAGDLSQPLFGMSLESYRSLAAAVGTIVHCGALVGIKVNERMLENSVGRASVHPVLLFMVV